MFINSKKSFRFTDGENELKIPAGYVGDFPDWAAKTYLYQLAVKGGDIVTVGEATTTVTVESVATASDVEVPVATESADSSADAETKGKGKA
jgi:hypothetical protein